MLVSSFLWQAYTIHEKKFGERAGIETVILKKRKLQYEEEVTENPMNYDAWFDLIRLVISDGDADVIRDTFEKAIANVPPSKEKQYWRRYENFPYLHTLTLLEYGFFVPFLGISTCGSIMQSTKNLKLKISIVLGKCTALAWT